MYCPQCGATNEENTRYCVACGLDIQEHISRWQQLATATQQPSEAQSAVVSQFPYSPPPNQQQPLYPMQPSYPQGYPYQPYSQQQAHYGAIPRISNYLGWAIASILLCWLVGAIAVYHSCQVGNKMAMGDYEGAMKSSKNAKYYVWLSFCIGTFFLVLAIIGVIIEG